MAYPTIAQRTEYALTSAGTTITPTFTQTTGDLVIVFLGLNDTAQSLSSVGDSFTNLTNTSATFHVLYKVLTGSEGGNLAITVGTSTKAAAIAYNISANTFAPIAPAISTVATGTSTGPDAGSCAPTGGAKDYLWISAFRQNGEEADDDTWCNSAPTSFGNLVQKTTGTAGNATTNGSIAAADYSSNASSLDAAAFNTDVSLAWRAYTLAIYPANKVYAQAQSKIKTVDVKSYAQAQVQIAASGPTTYRDYGQAQTRIKKVSFYSKNIANDSPVSHWRLNEPSGNVYAYDMITTNTGTHNGTVTLGVSGALFDGDLAAEYGSADYTNVPYTSALTPTTNFSLEIWCQMAAGQSGLKTMFGRSASTGMWVLYWDATTNYIHLDRNSGTGESRTPALSTATWYHVVTTYGAGSGSGKIYIDGKDVTIATTGTTFTADTSALQIGAEEAGSNWIGQLDEPAIYSSVLTPDKIWDHYTIGKIGALIRPAQAQAKISGSNKNYGQAQVSITNYRTLRDTFTRTVGSNSWGTPDNGPNWITYSSISSFSVDGSRGLNTQDGSGWGDIIKSPIALKNVAVSFKFRVNVVPTNSHSYIMFGVRSDWYGVGYPGGNAYDVSWSFNTSGVMGGGDIHKRLAGASTQLQYFDLGSISDLSPYYVDTDYSVRFEVYESFLKFKVWKSSSAEPDWIATATDTSLDGGGNFGFRFTGETTPTPTIFSIDDLSVSELFYRPAQAQARIILSGLTRPAQAQAKIIRTYQAYAQSQARIKTTYRVYAQANAQIKQVYRGYAQSQARIKQTYPRSFNYSQAILNDSPAGYWRLGESSGNPQDSSGNANHVTIVGGTPVYSVTGALTGDANTAVTFVSASSEYFSAPDHSTLDLGDVFTVEAWINRNTAAGGYVISKGNGAYCLAIGGSGEISLLRQDISEIVVASSNVGAGAWHHVVATKNGATVKLYLDSSDVTGTVTNDTASNTIEGFIIGAGYDGASNFFSGSIDEVAVYNYALTSQQVQAHYIAGTWNSTFAQGQGHIKTTYRGYAQSQGRIKTFYQVWAQGNSYIKSTGNKAYAQAPSWIKQTYPFGSSDVIVAQDSFTDTNFTGLNLHTAEIGGTWVYRYDSGSVYLTIIDNVVYPRGGSGIPEDGGGIAVYSINSLGNGYVQAYNVTGDTNERTSVYIRQITNDLDTYYFSSNQGIFRLTNGASTLLGTCGSDDWIRLQATGSNPTLIKAERRATQGALGTGWILETSDNTSANQAASGYIGILGGAIREGTENPIFDGILDNFLAIELGTGVTGPTFAQAQAKITAIKQSYAQALTNIKTSYLSYAQVLASVKASSLVYAQAHTWIKQTYPLITAVDTTVAQDSFTDTDATVLTSHTPEIGGSWSLWKTPGGNLSIYSNTLWAIRAGTSGRYHYRLGTTTLGDADHLNTGLYMGDDYSGGTWFRGIDSDNFYYIVEDRGLTTHYLYRLTANASTSLGSWTLGSTVDARIRVRVAGSSPTSIKVRDWLLSDGEPDTWKLEVSDNTAGNQTAAGAFGIEGSASTAISWVGDDYLVTTLGSGVQGPTYAQAQTTIIAAIAYKAYGQSQAQIKTTYQSYAQSLVQIKAQYLGYAQAPVWIKQTYPFGSGTTIIAQDSFTEAGSGVANLNTHTAEVGGTWFKTAVDIGTPNSYWQIDKTNDRASLYRDGYEYVFVAASIAEMADGYVQLNTNAAARDYNESSPIIRQVVANQDCYYYYSQDFGPGLFRCTNGVYISLGSISGSGNWVRIQATGSSPTSLKLERRDTQGELGTGWLLETNDNTAVNQTASGYVGIVGIVEESDTFSHDVDNFLAVSGTPIVGPTFAQSQAKIITTKQSYAQSLAHIRTTNRVWAQGNAYIKSTGNNTYAQVLANIKQTYPLIASGTVVLAQDDFNTVYSNLAGNPADIGGNYSIFYNTLGATIEAYVDGTFSGISGTPGGVGYLRVGTGTDGDSDHYHTSSANIDYDGGVWVRGIGSNNLYRLKIDVGNFWLDRMTGGSITNISSGNSGLSGVAQRSRVFVSGSSPTTLKVRLWNASNAEPGTWNIDTTENTAGNQTTAGAFGIWAHNTTDAYYMGDDYLVTTTGTQVYSPTFAQSQAKIKRSDNAYAQSLAQIKTTYQAYSQTQGQIKSTYRGFAQAHSWIKQTYPFGSGPTIIAQDSFTEAGTGTANLSTHTPEVGGPWFQTQDSLEDSDGWLIDKTNDRALMGVGGNFEEGAIVSYAIGSLADGYVQANLNASSRTYYPGLVVRQILGAFEYSSTFYLTDIFSGNLLQRCTESYSWTTIGTIGGSGGWYRLQATGSSPTQLKVERRTTQEALGTGWLLEVDDNNAAHQTSSGYMGIVGSADQNYDLYSRDVDDFLAVSGTPIVGPTFAQSQAKIKQSYLSCAQAQVCIKGNAFGQANTWIKDIGITVYAQAQSDIKATDRDYAQAQADIKATDRDYGQAQTNIKVTDREYGQAQSNIKTTYRVYGQANTKIILSGRQAYAQANIWIKTVGIIVCAQAQADIKVTSRVYAQAQTKLRTYGVRGYGQAQANIKTTYLIYGQALAQIEQTYRVYAQAQTRIKQTYLGYAQANTYIKVTNIIIVAQAQAKINAFAVQRYGQASVWIEGTFNVYAQAQAKINAYATKAYAQSQSNIKATYTVYAQAQVCVQGKVFAQAQADIKQTYRVYAQSQANIKDTSLVYAQAQSQIKSTYAAYGQAQADIKDTSLAYGQATADIKQTLQSWAQANAKIILSGLLAYSQSQVSIKSTYRVYAQAQVNIKAVSQAYANAQVDIKTSYRVYGQSQADIKTTYRVYGQSQSDIKQIYLVYAQAQVCIKGNAFAQAQASIKQTYLVYGQSQSWIKGLYATFAQAQTQIKTTYLSCAQSQAQIKQIYRGYAQANTYIKTVGILVYAQAQTRIKQTYPVYAQANTKIILSALLVYAQAGAQIKQTYLGYAQAQTRIKSVYQAYAQANTKIILSNLQGYAQAQTQIRATYRVYAQANTYIILSGLLAYAQALVWIKTTYQSVAQAQTKLNAFGTKQYGQASVWIEGSFIKSGQAQAKINAFGTKAYAQAQSQIKQTYIVYAQAQVDIKSTYIAYGQSQAQIKQAYLVYAQANSYIKTTGIIAYAQALSNIKQVYRVYGQAQSYIILSGRQGYAQTQAQVKQTYIANAQAQARLIAFNVQAYGLASVWIEGSFVKLAQAQARILAYNVNIYAQAQAAIKSTYLGYGQSNTYIKVEGIRAYGQAQARIKQVYQGYSQGQADIKTSYLVYAQAQAQIKNSYLVYAQSNAYVKVTNISAQAQSQAQIKQTYSVQAQANTYIRLSGLIVYAQSQAQIKQTYQVVAQAQAKLNAFGTRQYAQASVWVEGSFVYSAQAQAKINAFAVKVYGQAQVNIKTTYQVYAQAQTQVKSSSTQTGQAQALIKSVYSASAQAQSSIKSTYLVWAQGNAYIILSGRQAYGQAQAYIISGIKAYAQAQAAIKATSQAYAQASVWVAGSFVVFAQAQGKISAFGVQNYGQALADIKASYTVYAQAQVAILTTYLAQGQAQVNIKQTYQVVAQAQTNIKQVYSSIAQAQSQIKTAYLVHAQSMSSTLRVYSEYAQAQTDILAISTAYAQVQAQISQTYLTFAQAIANVKNSYQNSAQVLALIRVTIRNYAQAQAKLNAFDVQQYAQASVWIGGQAIEVAQAGAKINAFNINTYGQAMTATLQTSMVIAQAATSIKQTYQGYAQAQAKIISSYRVYGQAQAIIKSIYQGYAQVQVAVKATYQVYAQSFAQILHSYQGYANAIAQLYILGQGFANASALIKQTYSSYAQAQTQILGLYTYQQYGSAQALIKITVNDYAQALATIILANQTQSGQAQAVIISQYTQTGLAQASIKLVQFIYAQANANISKSAGYGQARVYTRITHQLKKLRVADRVGIDIILSDTIGISLTLSDREITSAVNNIEKINLVLADLATLSLDLEDREFEDRGEI